MAFTYGHAEDRQFKKRLQVAFILSIVLFTLLGTRLWYLQMFKGEFYTVESEDNSIRMKRITAPRGMIRDRFGQMIIDNKPNYVVSIVPEDVRDLDRLSHFIAQAATMPVEQVLERYHRRGRQPGYLPVQIRRGLEWHELAALEAYRHDYPGLEIEVESRRSYIYGDIAPHLLGYLSEINPQELASFNRELETNRYRQGDQVGKSGIEKQYERYLRGIDGFKTVRVDSSGREISELGRIEPQPGFNLHLTLDLDLQLYAREVFGDRAGALVALNPQTGEILAIVNGPSYDPEMWSGGISQANWEFLRDHPERPLLNRSIAGQYAPGSTYKIISAAAALEEGIITEDSTVRCTGSQRFGNRTFHCWKREGHGVVNLRTALAESCNVFFYNIGEKLGIRKLAEYASRLGLGRPTGIDVEGERGGLVPTPEWKRERLNEPWYPGETLPVVIGQGYNLSTPLQVAAMYGAIGIGGRVQRPHLLHRVTDADGHLQHEMAPETISEIQLQPSTVRAIQDGLAAAVNDRKGTGYWHARLPFSNIKLAGKTGTTQVVSQREDTRSEQFANHAWFAGFAPADNPEISVVALVEHGGSGSSGASPLVRQVVQKYFELKAERAGISVEELNSEMSPIGPSKGAR